MKKLFKNSLLKNINPVMFGIVGDEGGSEAPAQPDGILNGEEPPSGDTSVGGEPEQGNKPSADESPKPSEWYAGLPPEMHDKVKDLSAEDAAKVFERGAGYKPLEKADDVQIELADGVQLREQDVDGFKEFAVEAQLTKEQATKFAEWYSEKDREGYDEYVESNISQLKEVFKDDYAPKVQAAKESVSFLDKKMEGRLSGAVKAGLHSNAAFIEAMALLRPSFGEADISDVSAFGGEKPMDPKEYYGNFYKTPV